MSRAGRLTPFSYVILALVGRDGAGPHDIVRMMREGAIFWTTSESHYYAEPRRLAELGFLQARTEPGRTRPRTHYELTDAGREALTAWLAEPAAMPRVQNECIVKLLAADFSDDATIAASLAGVRAGIERAYQDLEEMERRALEIPHRTRYLRLIDDYARRSLDAQREWLDAVQEELGGSGAAERPHRERHEDQQQADQPGERPERRAERVAVADRQRAGGVDDQRHRVDVGERAHDARHGVGGDERRGGEHEREDPDEPDRLRGLGVAHGQPDAGADPREHVGEGEHERERQRHVVDRLGWGGSRRRPRAAASRTSVSALIARSAAVRPTSTAERAIGSERKRSTTPALMSSVRPRPVVSAPKIAVMTMIPGIRKST